MKRRAAILPSVERVTVQCGASRISYLTAALALHTYWLSGEARCRAAEQRPPDFEKIVARVLVQNCVSCHNASELKGGLDLTRQQGLLKGGKSGPAVVPGKPHESYLIERVTEGSMPPKRAGQRLSTADVELLRAWVAAGANWPEGRALSPFEFTTARRAGYDWWSLQPLSRPTIPDVKNRSWPCNPIDHFVVALLEQRGLAPAAETDRATYLRRAKYDVLGLPPTPEEVDAFVADRSANAYEKVIDRLLASPHYGERWGRHWLDVARFGESDGFENDKLRDHAWRYRDYVIRSFNADKPYTQFIKEQLAGDALRPITQDGIIASGFLVAGPWDEVQNVGKSQLERLRTREEQLEELIAAVAQTFLGLTANCARCHDHKFDPIPQTDYYRMKTVFEGVDHAEVKPSGVVERGNLPFFTPEAKQARDRLVKPIQVRIQSLQAELAKLDDALPGDANLEPADPKLLTDGRFGRALDARRGAARVSAKPAYQKPPLTVECWAKVFSKGRFNILVANQPKESAEHWEIYTYAGSGEFSAYLPGLAPAEIKSGVDITDGQWHHVAMTFDGGRVQLFVNAKLVKDAAVILQRSGGLAGSLYIGAYPPHKIGCDGVVDEVRISNTIRKIDRVPDAPFAIDPQTIGLWHLDRAENGRCPDSVPRSPRDRFADSRRRSLLANLHERESELAALAMPVTYSGVRRQPEATVVFLRGDIRKPGPRVTAGGLSPIRFLSPDLGLPSDAPEGERRRKFAEWVAHADNPLTARVMVNRIWQYHFGNGLVETPSDLGFNGGQPSHPDLLDWLAREFIASGWSVKHVHRLILLSATYRQSSPFNPRAAAIDSNNRLLWRYSPRRLEAEIVRDAMLAVSSELNQQVAGPSFRPFTVTTLLTNFYHLIDDGRPDFNRRTVYRMNVNTGKSPFLDALDCPAPSLTTPQRRSTTTPVQALALMNDSFVQRQAERFAHRLRRIAGNDRHGQVMMAYRLAFGRPPTQEERAASLKLAQADGLESVCWVLLNASEFLYVK